MTTSADKVAVEVKSQLARALEQGCSWGDVRLYDENDNQRLVLYDGNLETNAATFERGIGVRVLKDGAWGFAATADLAAIRACFDRAVANARAAAKLRGFPVDMGKQPAHKGAYRPPVVQDPMEVPLTEKLSLLEALDGRLRGKGVAQRLVTARFQRRRIFLWNTEGSEIERWVYNTFGGMTVMTPDKEGRTQRRSMELYGNGEGTRGWEWLTDSCWFGDHAERLRDELAQVVAADPLPPGKRDLIILPGQGFLQVHETIGHALELDRILGYELSYAGGSHVRPEMIGKLRYGSAKLNARAGVVGNSPGTFGYDDEGTPQRDYLLIDQGILVNVLSCRADIAEANAKAGREVVRESGTAARATAFYRTPIDRMTNINIDPSDDGSLDDIIAATEDGIIVDTPVSWSIGSNREHFHFGTEIAWEVKNGQKGKVYKNPTYQGHTLEFWNSLDMVGDKSTWLLQQVPNCGKGEPNQVMELGHGIPVMRFKNVQTGEKE